MPWRSGLTELERVKPEIKAGTRDTRRASPWMQELQPLAASSPFREAPMATGGWGFLCRAGCHVASWGDESRFSASKNLHPLRTEMTWRLKSNFQLKGMWPHRWESTARAEAAVSRINARNLYNWPEGSSSQEQDVHSAAGGAQTHTVGRPSSRNRPANTGPAGLGMTF